MRYCLRMFLCMTACLVFGCESGELINVPESEQRVHVVESDALTGGVRGRFCIENAAGDTVGIGAAKIEVLNEAGIFELVTETSDADGFFEISGLAVGQNTIRIRRGSQERVLDNIIVREGQLTDVTQDENCLTPEPINMLVVLGEDEGWRYEEFRRDDIGPVLESLGLDGVVEVLNIDVLDDFVDHAEQLGTLNYDVLFFPCSVTVFEAWDESELTVAKVERVMSTFLVEGGSVYVSDYGYDLLEEIFPEAIQWYGNESNHDDMHHESRVDGEQTVGARIVDEQMRLSLGKDILELDFLGGEVAPMRPGPASRVLVEADLQHSQGLITAPLVIEYQPYETGGRIIYTSTHHIESEAFVDSDVNQMLKQIVLSL